MTHGDHRAEGHRDHSVRRDADRRALAAVGALILGFVAAEVVVGFLASSLALFADAGHMLTVRPRSGSGLIITTGFDRADPIASLIVAALMIRAAYGLLRDSSRVLMEMAPAGTDPTLIGQTMADRGGLVEVHDLHVWDVTSGMTSLSAHVLVDNEHDCHEVRRGLERLLTEQFGIHHMTLRVDHQSEQTVIPLKLPHAPSEDTR